MTEANRSIQDEAGVPSEVSTFLGLVPTFRMLEFSSFPEERTVPHEWQRLQEEWLSADPASVTVRVLAELPNAEMLSFDLSRHGEGFPLGIFPMGFPEDVEPLDLTMSEYLDLATELSELEAQMFEGIYPYAAIIAAFDRRGLRDNEYWEEFLNQLAESRESTEERMRYIRNGER